MAKAGGTGHRAQLCDGDGAAPPEEQKKPLSRNALKRLQQGLGLVRTKYNIEGESVHLDGTSLGSVRRQRRRSLVDRLSSMDATMFAELKEFYRADCEHAQDMPHLYSDQALLRRESIMFDVGVHSALRRFWFIYDSDGNGRISKDEYICCNKLVQRILCTDFDDEKQEQIAHQDWIDDSGGFGFLNYERFTRSWFQLADAWTPAIAAEPYVDFLYEVLHCLAKEAEVGSDVFELRDEYDILSLRRYRNLKQRREKVKKVIRRSKGLSLFTGGAGLAAMFKAAPTAPPEDMPSATRSSAPALIEQSSAPPPRSDGAAAGDRAAAAEASADGGEVEDWTSLRGMRGCAMNPEPELTPCTPAPPEPGALGEDEAAAKLLAAQKAEQESEAARAREEEAAARLLAAQTAEQESEAARAREEEAVAAAVCAAIQLEHAEWASKNEAAIRGGLQACDGLGEDETATQKLAVVSEDYDVRNRVALRAKRSFRRKHGGRLHHCQKRSDSGASFHTNRSRASHAVFCVRVRAGGWGGGARRAAPAHHRARGLPRAGQHAGLASAAVGVAQRGA